MFGWFRKRRRKKILAEPWPESWDLHLNRNVRLTWNLSAEETERLKHRTKIFVAEKNWEGLEGLEVTEELKVTVAAQACLMIIGVEGYYFDNVKTILMFPTAFARETNDGYSTGTQHRAGEAWQDGPIVLSWRDSLRGCRNEDDGKNVVVHEFAHALDGLDGSMGGNIMFDDPNASQAWEKCVQIGYEKLVADKENGADNVLDYYGATNKAEFSAVATETFFEQPQALRAEHEVLFELLEKYFKLDPSNWHRTRKRRR